MGFEVGIFWGVVLGLLYIFARSLEKKKSETESRDVFTEAEEDEMKDN